MDQCQEFPHSRDIINKNSGLAARSPRHYDFDPTNARLPKTTPSGQSEPPNPCDFAFKNPSPGNILLAKASHQNAVTSLRLPETIFSSKRATKTLLWHDTPNSPFSSQSIVFPWFCPTLFTSSGVCLPFSFLSSLFFSSVCHIACGRGATVWFFFFVFLLFRLVFCVFVFSLFPFLSIFCRACQIQYDDMALHFPLLCLMHTRYVPT